MKTLTTTQLSKFTPIPGTNGNYSINEKGQVLSVRYNRLLKQVKNNSGYMQVCITNLKESLVHRLVLTTFLGNCPDGFQCDHINTKRDDNRLSNLRWISRESNQARRIMPSKRTRATKKTLELVRRMLINTEHTQADIAEYCEVPLATVASQRYDLTKKGGK